MAIAVSSCGSYYSIVAPGVAADKSVLINVPLSPTLLRRLVMDGCFSTISLGGVDGFSTVPYLSYV